MLAFPTIAAAHIADDCRRSFEDPYCWLFQWHVSKLAEIGHMATAVVGPQFGQSTHEDVDFVFDETSRWSGRAKQAYQTLTSETVAPPKACHLGELRFAQSGLHPALQAADLLAYEARRYAKQLEAGGGTARALWTRIHEKAPDRIYGEHWPLPRFSQHSALRRDYLAFIETARTRTE